jgi:glycosyltransferase involved in cell wall biosynthesis
MSARKGVDRLVRAVSRLQAGTTVVLAGNGEPGFESELERYCERMSAAGASVERIGELDESGAQDVLASARVAVLPYRRHVGMSRVLIEAAVAGTPVVADSFGLLGHLAEDWGLGTAVDTDDALAFAAALDRTLADPGVVEDLRRSVERIAGRQAFEAALARAFATS